MYYECLNEQKKKENQTERRRRENPHTNFAQGECILDQNRYISLLCEPISFFLSFSLLLSSLSLPACIFHLIPTFDLSLPPSLPPHATAPANAVGFFATPPSFNSILFAVSINNLTASSGVVLITPWPKFRM